ncbi:MAG: hypothetical protein AB1656_10710 [Candidatus Omnitrophota bacterium]
MNPFYSFFQRYSFLFIFASFLWLHPAIALCQTPERGVASGAENSPSIQQESKEAAPPADVYIGIFILRINSLSLRDKQLGVDFYIWFRWRDGKLKPQETFELINGMIDKRETIDERRFGEWFYACARVQANVLQSWNMSRYPMDSHRIRIEIEDSKDDISVLKYISDNENCSIDRNLSLTGWQLGDLYTQVIDYSYHTNYGDLELGGNNASYYSRFTCSIEVDRPSIKFAFKQFYGLYIAVMIGLATLLINPKHSSPRFSLSVGAVFTIMGNHFVVASNLPETSQLTLVDKLHIYAGFIILSCILASVASLKLDDKGYANLSRRLDYISFGLFSILFMALNYMAIAG